LAGLKGPRNAKWKSGPYLATSIEYSGNQMDMGVLFW